MTDLSTLTVVVLVDEAVVGDNGVNLLTERLPGCTVLHVPYVLGLARYAELRARTIAGETIEPSELPDELVAALRNADAVLGFDVPHDVHDFAPKLRLIQAISAGTEQHNVATFASQGITLCNAAGVAAPSIAEYIVGRVLEVYKDARRVEALQNDRAWKRHTTRELAGSTVAIVGLGAIGRATARRLRGWEVTLLGTRRRVEAGAIDPDVDEVFHADELDAILERADVVAVTVPGTAETNNMFDAERFATMKPGAIFCNVSRGSVVDQVALRAALESGHVGAAILDVTDPEPLPADDPLWSAPNLYLTPHSSTSAERYPERLLELFADNVTRLADGRPLRNQIDPELHYRTTD